MCIRDRGTRYGIRVDADGLLASGAEGVQLTWMDAKVGDWVVTPRRGKPVEIQALWFNAVSFLAELAKRLKKVPQIRLPYVESATPDGTVAALSEAIEGHVEALLPP